MALFNEYKRKKDKRTDDEIEVLRDARRPKAANMIQNDDTRVFEEAVPLIDQPSPRLAFVKMWKAPFAELKGTFYDSDLEEDPSSGPATSHHHDFLRDGFFFQQRDEHLEDVVLNNAQHSMNQVQRSHYVERPEERGFSGAR